MTMMIFGNFCISVWNEYVNWLTIQPPVQLLPEILDLVDVFVLEIEELFVPKVSAKDAQNGKYLCQLYISVCTVTYLKSSCKKLSPGSAHIMFSGGLIIFLTNLFFYCLHVNNRGIT